jgi:hypothetical protein
VSDEQGQALAGRALDAAVAEEIGTLRHRAEQNAEALAELRALLFGDEVPVDWAEQIEAMKAARLELWNIDNQMDAAGIAAGETFWRVAELRRERDEALADAEDFRQRATDRMFKLMQAEQERDAAREALAALWGDIGFTGRYHTSMEVQQQVRAVLGEDAPGGLP